MIENTLKNLTVIEGLDKSGKTTFTKKLHEGLLNRNIKSILTSEPTHDGVGKFIRDSIKMSSFKLDAKTLALLFSADRNEHIQYFNSIDDGTNIICDRYFFSSLAYQSIECGYEFIESINKDYPLPSIMFYMDTDLSKIQERLSSFDDKDHFENIEFLEKVHKNYQRVLDTYQKSVNIIQIKNNNYDIDDIITKHYLK